MSKFMKSCVPTCVGLVLGLIPITLWYVGFVHVSSYEGYVDSMSWSRTTHVQKWTPETQEGFFTSDLLGSSIDAPKGFPAYVKGACVEKSWGSSKEPCGFETLPCTHYKEGCGPKRRECTSIHENDVIPKLCIVKKVGKFCNYQKFSWKTQHKEHERGYGPTVPSDSYVPDQDEKLFVRRNFGLNLSVPKSDLRRLYVTVDEEDYIRFRPGDKVVYNVDLFGKLKRVQSRNVVRNF